MRHETDPIAQLLAAVAESDRAAFAELYRLTSGKMYAVARRMLAAEAEAMEALQEGFLRIWTRAGQYDATRGAGLHWMLGIMRNACVDRLRARRRQAEVVQEQDPELPEWEPAADPDMSSEIGLDLARCLGGLDADERRLVLLAVHQGHSHVELAARLGLPLGTVKSNIRRSMMKLRACLEPELAHGD